MAATTATKSRKKTPMSETTRRRWPRVVKRGVSSASTSRPSSRPSPRRGRKRTPDSIRKRLATIEAALPGPSR